MTPEEFAAGVKLTVFDAAVRGVIHLLEQGPPGRDPGPRGIAMSRWYAELGPEDRMMITEVAREAAHAATFHLLCVLDGVDVVDDPPHVELTLSAEEPDGAVTILGPADGTYEDLPDAFNAEVHPPSEPWPPR